MCGKCDSGLLLVLGLLFKLQIGLAHFCLFGQKDSGRREKKQPLSDQEMGGSTNSDQTVN